MSHPYFPEIFEHSIQEFKDHLNIPGNDRIIFSGKYGIGKTKFLDDFFDDKNRLKTFPGRSN
jgi:hypothetical protein